MRSECEWEGAGTSPSLPGTDWGTLWVDYSSFSSENSFDFQGSQLPTQTHPPGSTAQVPAIPPPLPFLPTAVLKPQESLAQLLTTPGNLDSENKYPAAAGGWPGARGEAGQWGQDRPQPPSEASLNSPLFSLGVSWGSLYLSPSHPTKPPPSSELAHLKGEGAGG